MDNQSSSSDFNRIFFHPSLTVINFSCKNYSRAYSSFSVSKFWLIVEWRWNVWKSNLDSHGRIFKIIVSSTTNLNLIESLFPR